MFGGSKSLKHSRLFCDFQIISSAQWYFPWLVESKKALKRPEAKTSWYNEWKWVFFFKVWTGVPKRVNRSVSCWKTVYERVFRKSFPVKKGQNHFWRRLCLFVLTQYNLVVKHKYSLLWRSVNLEKNLSSRNFSQKMNERIRYFILTTSKYANSLVNATFDSWIKSC